MIDYSRKRKSLVSTVVPNLDNKLNLVLLGDSFTAGDGSNSETIIPKLFDGLLLVDFFVEKLSII